MKKKDLDRIKVETDAFSGRESEEEEDLFPVPKNRFVAFLDILGFKAMVDTFHPDVVYTLYHDIIKVTPSNYFLNNCKIHLHIFSDSILLYTDDDSKESAKQILTYSQVLYASAFSCNVLLKGAVASGVFVADTKYNIFFGTPLIDAYQLEEDMKVSSIILHHTCEAKISGFKGGIFQEIVTVQTPFRTYNAKHAHLNWAVNIDIQDNDFKAFYMSTSGSSRVYIDNTRHLIDNIRSLKSKKL